MLGLPPRYCINFKILQSWAASYMFCETMADPDPGRRQELPRPVLQALLVCDQAIREAETNKMTLVGIFERVFGSEFPLPWNRPMAVYARVTDAEGEYDIRLELIRLADEHTIGRVDGKVAVSERVATAEIVFRLEDGLVFDRPGRYEFRLFANGQHVAGTVFTVIRTAER